MLDEVQFDGLTLPDVLSYLGEVVRQLDPDQVGINFLINPQLPTAPETSAVDPATGQVIPVPQWEPMDMNRVKIQISPALRQVRLGDVLEVITRGADRPISYSIEEYAIVFAPGAPGAWSSARDPHLQGRSRAAARRHSCHPSPWV